MLAGRSYQLCRSLGGPECERTDRFIRFVSSLLVFAGIEPDQLFFGHRDSVTFGTEFWLRLECRFPLKEQKRLLLIEVCMEATGELLTRIQRVIVHRKVLGLDRLRDTLSVSRSLARIHPAEIDLLHASTGIVLRMKKATISSQENLRLEESPDQDIRPPMRSFSVCEPQTAGGSVEADICRVGVTIECDFYDAIVETHLCGLIVDVCR